MVAVPHEKIVNLLATSVGEVILASMSISNQWPNIKFHFFFHFPDINENNADFYVSTSYWPGKSSLHLSDFDVYSM